MEKVSPILAVLLVLTVGVFAVGYRLATRSEKAQTPIEQPSVASPEKTEASTVMASIIGKAIVCDADTVHIADTRIRLLGIDAIESNQTCRLDNKYWDCGNVSKNAVAAWLGDRPTSCIGDEIDRYERLLAHCSVDGKDVGEWIVSNGWAFAYREYSSEYVGQEDQARVATLGVWKSRFEYPWEWRKTHRSSRKKCGS